VKLRHPFILGFLKDPVVRSSSAAFLLSSDLFSSMAPHLKGGKPYGTRSKPTLPSKFYVCRCESHGCHRDVCHNPLTNAQVSGRLVGLQALNEHRAADERMRAVEKLPASQKPFSSTPPPPHSPVTGTSSEPTTLPEAVPRPSSPKRVQKALSKILALHTEFRDWEERGIACNGLVFRHPPAVSDAPPPVPRAGHVNSGPYSLRSDSPYNLEFLSFEEALSDLLDRSRQLPRNQGTYMALDGLRAAIEHKFEWLQEQKVAEWVRQSQQSSEHVYSGNATQSSPSLEC
jgi:hypothetical protein